MNKSVINQGVDQAERDLTSIVSAVNEDMLSIFSEAYGFELGKGDISLSGSMALKLQGYPRVPRDIDYYVDDIQIFDYLVSALSESSVFSATDISLRNHARFGYEDWFIDLIVSPVTVVNNPPDEDLVGRSQLKIALEKPRKIILDGIDKSTGIVPQKICVDIVFFLTNNSAGFLESIEALGDTQTVIDSIERLDASALEHVSLSKDEKENAIRYLSGEINDD